MESIYELKDWELNYLKYDPALEKHTEALCTVGNGYMGTRGAHEEALSSASHYPGTYIAGIYNRLNTRIAGKTVDNEDLVNCPDWTQMNFRIGGGPWFDIDKVEVLDYLKQLDFRRGLLNRMVRFRDKSGKITVLISQRFIGMHAPHLCALQYVIVPENHSSKITVRSALNGRVINEGVERYRQLNSLHLKHRLSQGRKGQIQLAVTTTESGIEISQAAGHKLLLGGKEIKPSGKIIRGSRTIAAEYSVQCAEGVPLRLDKIVCVHTSSDENVSSPLKSSEAGLSGADGYDAILKKHAAAWDRIWDRINIEIDGGEEEANILRFHSYHMMTCASSHNTSIDASVPARGLHGEAYRGHIFWDDLFVQPFFASHYPEVARSLLMYRVRRLDKAREYARENGYRGAMFPWQSGSDGREETQVIHLNPVSGKWGDDYSRRQRHISLAVFHDVWEYCHVTGDIKFLAEHGAEVLFEVARFWVSMTRFDEKTGRFEINGVMGPDEFHEKLPGAKEAGLKDNAYTNLMTAWALERCFEAMALIPKAALGKIEKRIGLSAEEKKHWKKVSRGLGVNIKGGIVSQFDGYMGLKELDWARYRKQYANIGRMDRLLKAEGHSPDSFRLSKQADFLMLFYMLSLDEVIGVFKKLGYRFGLPQLRKNYNFYLARTSHGSTLSFVVHTHLAALLGNVKMAHEWFGISLGADIGDIQGGTTKEGIHAGLMGGTIQLLLRSFAGIDTSGRCLRINPRLPRGWKAIRFGTAFRKVRYRFEVTPVSIGVSVEKAGPGGVPQIMVGGKKYRVSARARKILYGEQAAA